MCLIINPARNQFLGIDNYLISLKRVQLSGKDLNIKVYRQPSPTGYQDIQKFYRQQSLSIQALLGIDITVDEVLG